MYWSGAGFQLSLYSYEPPSDAGIWALVTYLDQDVYKFRCLEVSSGRDFTSQFPRWLLKNTSDLEQQLDG